METKQGYGSCYRAASAWLVAAVLMVANTASLTRPQTTSAQLPPPPHLLDPHNLWAECEHKRVPLCLAGRPLVRHLHARAVHPAHEFPCESEGRKK
jgi:hypothetical protein